VQREPGRLRRGRLDPGGNRFAGSAGGIACPVLRFAGGPGVLAGGEGESAGHGQSADVGRIAGDSAEFASGGAGRRRCRRLRGRRAVQAEQGAVVYRARVRR
jgi:hypothetical protein